ncbi:tRNA-dihydrouridine synthase, partial [Microvirga sp. 3-52]|nr:tRNA-dihydrouridine synthase [Microvirga sp. 3-52]
TASTDNRPLFLDTIATIAKEVPIPFIVGGGIRTLEDIQHLLDVGTDKVSINSSALDNPQFIKDAANKFGSERVILSMDVKKVGPSKWSVFSKGGRVDTGLDAIEWAVQGEELGAGELVINSIDGDGEKEGYDLELNRTIAQAVKIPIIASGGAGKMEDFEKV